MAARKVKHDMHMSIVALVRAYDKASALDEAKKVFDKLMRDGPFDSIRVPTAYKYESEKGKATLQTVFGYQTLEFNEHLAQLRITLTESPARSDAQLMEDHSFRFHCWQVGESCGSAIRVYDEDGEGVQDNHHLKNVIEDWPSLVADGKHRKSPHPLWVVSTSAHY